MGVPLIALQARFVRLHGSQGGYREEPTIESADGISFVCPLCWLAAQDQTFDRNVGVRGVHSVLCWRPRVPADVSPGPGRWDFQGTGLRDVTLVAGSSSIQLIGGCAWHGYVRSGECVDDLGPESVERARAYHRNWKQSIIDREKATMAEPTDQTQTDAAKTETIEVTEETKALLGATDGASGATEPAQGETVHTDQEEDHDEAPVVAPAGFVKTLDLRVHEGRLEQRWVSGHDGSLDPVWVEIEGQRR